MLPMTLDPSQLPDDIAILKAMVIAGGREIEALKLTIAKMRRDKFSASSERGAKLLDQLELQLAESTRRPTARTGSGPSPLADHCLRICHASVWCIPPRRHARAAVGPRGSWARTSPRRWNSGRRSGG
jgi:hypothetical protein